MTTTRMKLKEETHQILDDLSIAIEIFHNPYKFDTEHLFKMATRINKKRSFLFVSTILGKHLAVDPKIPLLVGHLLSLRYAEVVYGKRAKHAPAIADAIKTGENVEEAFLLASENLIELTKPISIIGFAETATALGHSVFSAFKKNATYIHTTREKINERTSVINFEEEHSHASSHRVYPNHSNFFNNEQEIVLVDDEITTGKTAINIIRKIKSVYPNKKVYTVISILDWRTPEYRDRFRQLEEELEITIHTVSLMDGTITVYGQPNLELDNQNVGSNNVSNQKVSYLSIAHYLKNDHLNQLTSIHANGSEDASPYLKATGRFGLHSEEDKKFSPILEDIGSFLKECRKSRKTLVIGTGEFMYVPMMIASFMGGGVYFQSTTRSPIYAIEKNSYPILNKLTFDSPENKGVVNFLYNIEANQYDELFIFVERASSNHSLDSLLSALKQTQIKSINVIIMTETNGALELNS